jgi:hypothetical protein
VSPQKTGITVNNNGSDKTDSYPKDIKNQQREHTSKKEICSKEKRQRKIITQEAKQE